MGIALGPLLTSRYIGDAHPIKIGNDAVLSCEVNSSMASKWLGLLFVFIIMNGHRNLIFNFTTSTTNYSIEIYENNSDFMGEKINRMWNYHFILLVFILTNFSESAQILKWWRDKKCFSLFDTPLPFHQINSKCKLTQRLHLPFSRIFDICWCWCWCQWWEKIAMQWGNVRWILYRLANTRKILGMHENGVRSCNKKETTMSCLH